MKKVYIGMTADIIHHGHINVIQKGCEYGEVTIGLLTDRAVTEYKRLPHLAYEQRKKILENIKGVKEVIPQEEWDYTPTLRKIKPDFMIHGDDWQEGVQKKFRERAFEAMKEWGGQIIEVAYTSDVSSTKIEQALKENGISPQKRLQSLKRLLDAKDYIRVMEAHSGLSALIVEKSEIEIDGKVRSFDAMWSSSLTDSTVRGKPDIEAVSLTSRMVTLNDIFEVTTRPLIYDADTGGQLEHFPFTVRSLERLGVSALVIEDKTGLKKNSLLGNDVFQQQDSIENFQEKIAAGQKAKVHEDFMIIARIESLILDAGMDDAIKRAEAYIEAGASGIMIHSRKKEPDEIFEFCRRYNLLKNRKYLMAVPTSFNTITERELAAHGINIITHANHLLRSSYQAMQKVANSILTHERTLESDPDCISIKEVLKLIPGTI